MQLEQSTTGKGNSTEAMVLAALVRSGKTVLLPFGDGCRYDMVIDDAGKLYKVQCKSGKLKKGTITFAACNVQRDTQKRRSYVGEIDFFGVYCPQNNGVYLVPVDISCTNSASLRVEPTKNGQAQRIRWAKDFEI